MPIKKFSKEQAEKILEEFTKIQKIRQDSLEILKRIDEKVGKNKIEKFKKRLEELTE